MDVLIVGSGVREHALAWCLAKSPAISRLYASPGNAGMAECCTCLDPLSDAALAEWAGEHADLVVIGPEAPLARGLADRLRSRGVGVFGPSQAAARIESSKAYAKGLMRGHGIPTAEAITVHSRAEAEGALMRLRGPVVVKANGLAAGKGVFVTDTAEEARDAVAWLMDEQGLGEAGQVVLLEERLEGPELSCLVLTDGQRFQWLPPARDYKRLRDGDEGPNTGGMGAEAPHPAWTTALQEEVADHIVEPMLAAMRAAGHPFTGVLYAGLMLTADGPRVLEWNVRFGDPETAVMLPLLDQDLLPHLWAVAQGRLSDRPLSWSRTAVGVVLAAPGYPEAPQAGIHAEVRPVPGALVFHAATLPAGPGAVLTTGGRSFCAVGVAGDLAGARAAAYRQVGHITFPGALVRGDIAASDSLS
jgi:phosphoribosylamine--glycine ligase